MVKAPITRACRARPGEKRFGIDNHSNNFLRIFQQHHQSVSTGPYLRSRVSRKNLATIVLLYRCLGPLPSCASASVPGALHLEMSSRTTQLGLRLAHPRPSLARGQDALLPTRRLISSVALTSQLQHQLRPRKPSPLAANPPSSTTPSSFFTPSLCRTRNASTIADPSAASANTSLDWNTFFRMRTIRRRYSLTSSILTSLVSTGGALYAFSEIPAIADNITKVIPTDPVVALIIATFSSTVVGWLLGPAAGNTIWRLSHRTRLQEFIIKERGFFERIKKHRVNPSGASTNNPVPDFYGEKVGSVSGYRRWLKDQRAFNRKRGGNYAST